MEGFMKVGIVDSYDSKKLLFTLSKYKFVAKMLYGMDDVLEVGCGDGCGTSIVVQNVKRLTAIDLDIKLIHDVNKNPYNSHKFKFKIHDILEKPVHGNFDGAYAIDVLEHIPKKSEERFIANITKSLSKSGVLIIGVPSIESKKYAISKSKMQHANCKDYAGLRNLISKYFHNVFIFSMNDEVVHTGFSPLAHYFIAVCCCKKK